MYSRLRRDFISAGVVLTFASTALLAVGCSGFSPFLAAAFNANLSADDGVQSDGRGFTPAGDGDANNNNDDNEVLASVCDLPVGQRTIAISIQNVSVQFVEFSMTFAVSAGDGGFVCDDELQEYLNAGYTDAIIPGSGATHAVGCDTLSLGSGTRLLTLEFGINQGFGSTLTPNIADNDTAIFPDNGFPRLDLRRRDNGSQQIPLPELIVFGNSDFDFVCIGNDLCTQRGFVYVSTAGIPIGKAAEVARIQGTICGENAGTAPEWRLDKTLNTAAELFQYAAGGTIIAGVLDRWQDDLTNNRNQVVWQVSDANDNIIHFPNQ